MKDVITLYEKEQILKIMSAWEEATNKIDKDILEKINNQLFLVEDHSEHNQTIRFYIKIGIKEFVLKKNEICFCSVGTVIDKDKETVEFVDFFEFKNLTLEDFSLFVDLKFSELMTKIEHIKLKKQNSDIIVNNLVDKLNKNRTYECKKCDKKIENSEGIYGDGLCIFCHAKQYLIR